MPLISRHGRGGGKAPPVWSTASQNLGTLANSNRAATALSIQQLVANDGDTNSNSGLTYSVVSGTFPPGLSLNSSTGAITGTANGVSSNTNYSFTIRATDVANQSVDRTFDINVNAPIKTLANGGSISSDASYRYHTFNGQQSTGFNIYQGEAGATVEVFAWGAGGGGGGTSGNGGAGGYAYGLVPVNIGETLTVSVGGGGGGGAGGCRGCDGAGGGGGGPNFGSGGSGGNSSCAPCSGPGGGGGAATGLLRGGTILVAAGGGGGSGGTENNTSGSGGGGGQDGTGGGCGGGGAAGGQGGTNGGNGYAPGGDSSGCGGGGGGYRGGNNGNPANQDGCGGGGGGGGSNFGNSTAAGNYTSLPGGSFSNGYANAGGAQSGGTAGTLTIRYPV